jgi:hypothetical protein
MTAPARITQADLDRATKAVVRARIEHARILIKYAQGQIEIIIGDKASAETFSTNNEAPEAWNDDDV